MLHNFKVPVVFTQSGRREEATKEADSSVDRLSAIARSNWLKADRAMQVQFLNHASVRLITSHARITSDPWYSGAVFNNGWDLIRTRDDLNALASEAMHFWLSHEHPDHFSVEFFKSTPNRSAHVLFQKTADQRVA